MEPTRRDLHEELPTGRSSLVQHCQSLLLGHVRSMHTIEYFYIGFTGSIYLASPVRMIVIVRPGVNEKANRRQSLYSMS